MKSVLQLRIAAALTGAVAMVFAVTGCGGGSSGPAPASSTGPTPTVTSTPPPTTTTATQPPQTPSKTPDDGFGPRPGY